MRSLCRCSILTLLLGAPLVSSATFGQESESAQTIPSPNPSAAPTTNPGVLAAIVERLSVESRKDFAELLREDWKDPPEWVEMLVAMLSGKELGPDSGWYKPSQMRYDWKWLSARFDANQDGEIVADELPQDGSRTALRFARLDRNRDSKLQAADFDYVSRQQSSPPETLSQMLSYMLDSDSNGRITSDELLALLARADHEEAGFLTSEDLLTTFGEAFAERSASSADRPGSDEMLSMFFRGELGMWESGPQVGDEAPDFTLPTHDGSQTITLSSSRGKPVILIFGSFT